VAGARTLLEQAGPYAGSRADATNRTMLLALLQPIEADSLPALGTAFLALERGDTATAVSALEQLAVALPVEQGGAELRLHAGRLEMTRGRAPQAEAHFRAAAASDDAAAAPAALLELGRLLTREGRGPEAVPVLEQLILSHPKSALVPQARRALDEARGAVPSA
jgi:predicted Zn-dependent protease